MTTEEVSFGAVTCASGNDCSVRMEIQKADKVSLMFSWARTPTPDDLEEWGFTILGMALDRAMHEAFVYRAAIETLRGLEAEGAIERCGITDDGDWYFRSTEQSTAGGGRGGIVNLASVRARRRQRRRRGLQR